MDSDKVFSLVPSMQVSPDSGSRGSEYPADLGGDSLVPDLSKAGGKSIAALSVILFSTTSSSSTVLVCLSVSLSLQSAVYISLRASG